MSTILNRLWISNNQIVTSFASWSPPPASSAVLQQTFSSYVPVPSVVHRLHPSSLPSPSHVQPLYLALPLLLHPDIVYIKVACDKVATASTVAKQ